MLTLLGVLLIIALVVCVRGAIKSNPMLQEINLHRKKIEELKSSGQEQLVIQEEEKFNKRMRGLAESDHGSSMSGGFF